MKKQSLFLRAFLVAIAFLAFKWNCLTWRQFPGFSASGSAFGGSTDIQTLTTNSVPGATNGLSSVAKAGRKARKAYRGIPLAELIPAPWTREKALQAQHEPWWGRPLDPVLFWEGRPVWMDDESVGLANRRGRVYPPVPVQFSSGGSHPQKISDPSSIEYRMPKARYTDEEARFWNRFSLRSPQPPEWIDRWLWRWADCRMYAEKKHEARLPDGRTLNLPDHWKSKEPETTVASAREDAKRHSQPVEAATADALYWEYVRLSRIEHEREISRGGGNFIRRLHCPAELVLNPPSDEELRVTRGWRVAYLRRLRREGTDESYVEAYKKAWNLSEDDLKEAEE